MFELRTTAGWSGAEFSPDTASPHGKVTERPAITFTALELQQELPHLLAEARGFEARGFAASAGLSGHRTSGSRLIDLVVAVAALVFFAPLMAFIAIAIMASERGPILFRQARLGLGGRTFGCLKFRTMRHDAERMLSDLLSRDPSARAEWEHTHKLRLDPRVSRLGRFLRKTSLDELPQLLNVLWGDMSIVGPRPIVPDEAFRYRRHIKSYYAVKPGITGLWQISGRNHTTYRRRVACDVQYVRSRNPYRDIAIIVLTIPTALLGRGAY